MCGTVLRLGRLHDTLMTEEVEQKFSGAYNTMKLAVGEGPFLDILLEGLCSSLEVLSHSLDGFHSLYLGRIRIPHILSHLMSEGRNHIWVRVDYQSSQGRS